MAELILDAGSTHLGRMDRVKRLIDTAKNIEANRIKFQLFKQSGPGNVPIPYEWWEEIQIYADNAGISCSASAFDLEAVDILKNGGAEWAKIAYSQRENVELITRAVEEFKEVIVTTDLFTDLPATVTRLWTAAGFSGALYPVHYDIDFEGMFNKHRFQGVSLHTLGVRQALMAVKSGAQLVEMHFSLGDDDSYSVPDGKFALRPQQARKIVEFMKWN